MFFSKIPNDLDPIGQPLVYSFFADNSSSVTFSIIDTSTNEVIGKKQFYNTMTPSCNIAPYLRNRIHFRPTTGISHVEIPTDRVFHIAVEAFGHKRQGSPNNEQPIRFGENGTRPIATEMPTKAITPANAPTPAPAKTATTESARTTPLADAPTVEPSVDTATSADTTSKTPATSATATDSATPPSGDKITSKTLTFVATDSPLPNPSLITTMPLKRTITQDGCDEITFTITAPQTVVVYISGLDAAYGKGYAIEHIGLNVFRLYMKEFPKAEKVHLSIGSCGSIEYTVIPQPKTSIRLAWRSRAGSMEYYNFPIVSERTIKVLKQSTYTSEGYSSKSQPQQITRLRSAYESEEMLTALSDLLSTPDVWMIPHEGSPIPIHVLTEEAIIQRRGTMSYLEIDITPTLKPSTSWN